jgi:putative RNA 2'-phosphotransferase
MSRQRSPKQLAKFISYILARRPDEFGLVPDQNGFVKVKDLLKAIGEEPDWKYVRRSHIDEILITLPSPLFEVQGSFIRAASREHLSLPAPADNLPKLLYTCIRSRAYPFVVDKGIHPTGHPYVILSSSTSLAERMGRRIDQTPVKLTVQVEKTLAKGKQFWQAGKLLYLAENIPPDCFSGPPMPKEKPEARKPEPADKESDKTKAGSFFMDLKNNQDRVHKPGSREKRKALDWKKDRRKQRKLKQKLWKKP